MPVHFGYAHRFLKALGDEVAAVGEEEPFARAEAAHRVRHQYLSALRLRGDARRQDHRRAEQVAIFAVLVSMALAAAVLLSPKPAVLVLILAIALAAVAFDVREAIHQADESRETVMTFAIAAAALHAAAAAFAGVALVRGPTALLSRQSG